MHLAAGEQLRPQVERGIARAERISDPS